MLYLQIDARAIAARSRGPKSSSAPGSLVDGSQEQTNPLHKPFDRRK
jgi:hypothetical protein